MRPLNEVIDEIESILLADGVVPPELATELLCALPVAERERWLEVLLGLAKRAHDDERP